MELQPKGAWFESLVDYEKGYEGKELYWSEGNYFTEFGWLYIF